MVDSFYTALVPYAVTGQNEKQIRKCRDFSHIAVRGNDEILSMDELRAWWNVVDVAIANATKRDPATIREIDRESDLYIWWVQFVFRRLKTVRIRSEEFQNSRAGLIPDQSMSLLRKAAGLSLTEFRDSSLSEVFGLIEETHSEGIPDVTIQMLIDHSGCGRQMILNAMKGHSLTKERRGKPDWFIYTELKPLLPKGFQWPLLSSMLKRKTAKNSK